jgi:adenine-specific DNA-methyltransferase
MAKGDAGYGAKCDELRGFIFEPLRAYLDGERIAAGLTPEDANEVCGHRRQGGMAGRHYFSPSQWYLPTPQNYAKLQVATGYFTRPYEDLRLQYEDLRLQYEELRRPFTVTADVPYTDVWDFPTVSPYHGKHECEKPQPLLQHIIKVSSREDATILDTFCGGGSTGEAALALGRDVILCDKSEHWANYTRMRLERLTSHPTIGQARLAL